MLDTLMGGGTGRGEEGEHWSEERSKGNSFIFFPVVLLH